MRDNEQRKLKRKGNGVKETPETRMHPSRFSNGWCRNDLHLWRNDSWEMWDSAFFFLCWFYSQRGPDPIIDFTCVLGIYWKAPMPIVSSCKYPMPFVRCTCGAHSPAKSDTETSFWDSVLLTHYHDGKPKESEGGTGTLAIIQRTTADGQIYGNYRSST